MAADPRLRPRDHGNLFLKYVCETNNEAVHQLFIDFKKAYDSVRREAL